MWNILTPLMKKKSPSWLHNVGGDFFTMLHPQARDHLATWKSKRCWIPWSVSWWSPPQKKNMSAQLLHQTLQSPKLLVKFIRPRKKPCETIPLPRFPLGVSQVLLLVLPSLKQTSYTPQKYPTPDGNFIFQPLILRVWAVSFGLLTNSCISRLWFQPIWKNMPQIGSFPQRSGWK